jgi:predicted metalloprotease with PDZ domain
MKVLLFLLLLAGSLMADEGYHYSVNLQNVEKDKVQISLSPPDISQQEIEFMFPAMVPGTYEVYDFGRFISNFKVTGRAGAEIKVVKLDANRYRISGADKIEKITYDVDDTFDKSDLSATKKKVVFEPGGANFEAGMNFSLNTHCLFGYIKGVTNRKFTLEFIKPQGFYPSTGLSDIRLGDQKDVITVFDYHHLVDSPIMYCRPDTATVLVGGTQVLVSAYAPHRLVTADFIAATLKTLLYAQADYLGGKLPVEKYAFLFYFTDKPTLSGSMGALEHSYSSFYVLQEYDSVALKQQLRDVAAHEFFHIVTPLTIHSEEIGNFDFNNPRMSKHLWLYEGMTEYAAHHAQVRAGITDINQFLTTLLQKYESSLENYNDTMSFTYMSKHVLEEKIHKQYGNVYEKGAVIGMCLDILLRDLSDGVYGTRDLMHDLATKYGKDRSFKDDSLFSEIEKFTYPQVGEFLRKYVGGNMPLPMSEIFSKVGFDFNREIVINEFSLGNPDLNYNPDSKRLYVESTRDMDEFGKELGYKKGDELYKLNGREIEIENVKEIVNSYYENLKEGDVVTVDIYRPKMRRGKYKAITLKAKARKIQMTRKNQIGLADKITERQKLILKSWIGY